MVKKCVFVLISVVILIVLLIIFIPNNYDFSDLKICTESYIYKKNSLKNSKRCINLSEEEKQKVIDKLKKVKFEGKDIAKEIDNGKYKVTFDDCEISFNKTGTVHFYNENGYKQISLSDDVREYIINLVKEEK